MYERRFAWKNALIALATVALLTVGLGIIVYVGLARDRILPTPTSRPTRTQTLRPSVAPLPSETSEHLATVVGLVKEYSPGALIIIISPIEGDVTQIIVPENLTVFWADGKRASPRDIAPGQTLFAEGTLDAIGRMIASQITIVQGEAQATPSSSARPPATQQPSPTVTPSPSVQGWQGEYFDNPSLAGSPALVRVDAAIDFRWQQGSPAPEIPADRFSVRWRRRWLFEEGGYRFYAYSDDGVRLWVDGILIINQWRDQAATLVYGDLSLSAGEHEVLVEYYEGTDNAEIRVWWDQLDLYPDWKGEYFSNPDLAGTPVLTRNDAGIAFDWGDGAPAPQVPADNFSVRWTRTITFEEGAYRINARADDGVRLWVDGLLLIDEWHPASATTYSGYIWLGAGPHALRVEYFEAAGKALARVGWERIRRFSAWKGEYFANANLAGNPAFVRDDASINFDWQTGSPGAGLPVDNFSVRWSRTVELPSGRYLFWANADDGVRIYVDGQLVINEWHDSPETRYQVELALGSGSHALIVEYYERGDKALIQIGWETVSTPTPTLTPTLPTPTFTPTCTPTLTPVSPTPTPSPTRTPLTPTLTPSLTLTRLPSKTPEPPSPTPVSPTATRVPSKTPEPPSLTPVPPTATFTSEPPSPTPTPTPTPEASPTLEPTATTTSTAQPTPSIPQALG